MWILFDSGNRNGRENMHLDEWLAKTWFPQTGIPVFRLYGWSPYSVSLGFHQSDKEIDEIALSSKGYTLVRRPTGGRAVFHAEEITYSVVLDATYKSVNDVYEQISRVLVYGLRSAGFDVTFSGEKNDLGTHYRDKKSVSCFTASTEYEIKLAGRKLVGSAQRRYFREDGGITALQHGSILTGPKHLELVEILRIDENAKQRLKNIIDRSSISLSESNDSECNITEIKKYIKDSVRHTLAQHEIEERDHNYFISRMSETESVTEQTI